jgi:hypothetical protein
VLFKLQIIGNRQEEDHKMRTVSNNTCASVGKVVSNFTRRQKEECKLIETVIKRCLLRSMYFAPYKLKA